MLDSVDEADTIATQCLSVAGFALVFYDHSEFFETHHQGANFTQPFRDSTHLTRGN
jgi:hypothetical protein